jgi:hypothetical protein
VFDKPLVDQDIVLELFPSAYRLTNHAKDPAVILAGSDNVQNAARLSRAHR